MKYTQLIFIITLMMSICAHAKFSTLFTHPSASKQSTDSGQSLDTLHVYNGQIFMGYGDYGANTGPIDIYNYEPLSGNLNFEYTMGTEAIEIFRPINGQLYIPAADPAWQGVSHDYVYKKANGEWGSYFGLASAHVYDAFTFTGSDLWMVGSKGYDAALWRSYDNGISWFVEKSVSTLNPGKDFSRFYFAGKLNGKLYVQPKEFYSSEQRPSLVYNGVQWVNGPYLFSSGKEIGSKMLNFKNKLVYRGAAANSAGEFYYFDGSVAIASMVTEKKLKTYDYAIYKNKVYVLATDGCVYESADLVSWRRVAKLKHKKGRSLAIHNNMIYVGTSDSRLQVSSL